MKFVSIEAWIKHYVSLQMIYSFHGDDILEESFRHMRSRLSPIAGYYRTPIDTRFNEDIVIHRKDPAVDNVVELAASQVTHIYPLEPCEATMAPEVLRDTE